MLKLEKEIEENLITKLVDMGYNRIKLNSEKEIKCNLVIQLRKINNNIVPKLELSDIRKIYSIILGTNDIVKISEYLREGIKIDRDNILGGRSVIVKLYEKVDFCHNNLQVTNQFVQKNAVYKNRYDVTILANGIPIIQIELKRPNISINKAIEQINNYRRNAFTGIMKFIQVFIVSNNNETRYFGNKDYKIPIEIPFVFKYTDKSNKDILNLFEFTNIFLDRCEVGRLISKYSLIDAENKTIIVLRPYQMHAMETILNHKDSGGYIWHTTGSGKTLTSFQTSKLLSSEEDITKVIFVVDRNDLDFQTKNEFERFSGTKVADSKNMNSMIKSFKSSSVKILITTIQKLVKAVKNNLLSNEKECKYVFIFDECHRSQAGSMNKDIKNYFINSKMFGFTGTPIFKANSVEKIATTKDIFGKCLHKYTLEEAIRDNNVLGFHYIEYDLLSNKDKEKLKKLEKLGKDKEFNIDISRIFDNEKRQKKIIKRIIEEHDIYTSKRDFSSLFTVHQIKNILKYYKLFMESETDLRVTALFSLDLSGKENNLDEMEMVLQNYNEMMKSTKYSTSFTLKGNATINDVMKNYRKHVMNRLKGDNNKEIGIDIVIVHDMLMTGFDSKKLNTLYIDKNLKHHGLIQAFSRTNRTLNSTKNNGKIISFRSLKKNVDEAIKLFNNSKMPEYGFITGKFDEYYNKLKEMLNILFKGDLVIEKLDTIDITKKQNLTKIREILKTDKILTYFPKDYENKFKNSNIGEIIEKTSKLYYQFAIKHLNEDKVDKDEIDFDYELRIIHNTKIDETYILKLIENEFINKKTLNDFEKKKLVKKILEEIDKSKNVELFNRKNLIRQFILNHNINLEENNIYDSFSDFINSENKKAVEKLSDKFLLTKENKSLLFDILKDFEYLNIYNKRKISQLSRRASKSGINSELKKQVKELLLNKIIK